MILKQFLSKNEHSVKYKISTIAHLHRRLSWITFKYKVNTQIHNDGLGDPTQWVVTRILLAVVLDTRNLIVF